MLYRPGSRSLQAGLGVGNDYINWWTERELKTVRDKNFITISANFFKNQVLLYTIQEEKYNGVDLLTEEMPNGAPGEEVVRVRLPQKGDREMFAMAELMMGANHIRVKCFDGVSRLGRIKGKIKKKVWIREGDVLVVVPWSFQDDKCDIIYRYTGPQVEWLRRNRYL
jgi:translation initiation factor 1A